MKSLSILLAAFLIAISATTIVYAVTLVFTNTPDNQCSGVVFIEGELSKDFINIKVDDAKKIAYIHLCDGNTLTVKTNKIIKIVE